MPRLSDHYPPDRVARIQETYVENVVDWATLPPDEAKVSADARITRLLNLLFEDGGDDGET